MSEFAELEDQEEVNEQLEQEEWSEAGKAAQFVRSFEGFEKAADYVEHHFDGEEFDESRPIPISTRNQDLEDDISENGVAFTRREVELEDGLCLEGVFPEFDSIHHVELGKDVHDMSLHKQFNACREDFQDHLYDPGKKLEGIKFGDMERMDLPQGYAPKGYTWNHNPETGSFDLVSTDQHSVGHTGGNALWGKK